MQLAQPRPKPRVEGGAGLGRRGQVWAASGKAEQRAIPRGEASQFPEKQRNQVLPRVLQFFSSLKLFFNRQKQNQIEQR